MVRECAWFKCEHYALHKVRTSDRRYDLQACHLHVGWVAEWVARLSPWTVKVEVSTSSAVVVGDIRDWRTLSITAYDEFRQIGA
jgi:hypothetical protein